MMAKSVADAKTTRDGARKQNHENKKKSGKSKAGRLRRSLTLILISKRSMYKIVVYSSYFIYTTESTHDQPCNYFSTSS